MNAPPLLLQNAVRDLFTSWLHDCRRQVGEHLAQNGDHAIPEEVAAACPWTFGDPALAAWAMEQNGHRKGRRPP